MTQTREPDPRNWTIHRNRRGWPRWYQRWLEAWWIISGRWSLHRAWQDGVFHGSHMEHERLITNRAYLAEVQLSPEAIATITAGATLKFPSIDMRAPSP